MAAYMFLWGLDPTSCGVTHLATCKGAFAGAGSIPTVGDFAYYATSTAFFNTSGNLQAVSRGAHGLQIAEMITAAGLLAAFATQLGFAIRRRGDDAIAEK